MAATPSMTAFSRLFVWLEVRKLLSYRRGSAGDSTSAFPHFLRESWDRFCLERIRVGLWVAPQSMIPRDRALAVGDIRSKSRKVRKSMVLNSRSSAGGP